MSHTLILAAIATVAVCLVLVFAFGVAIGHFIHCGTGEHGTVNSRGTGA